MAEREPDWKAAKRGRRRVSPEASAKRTRERRAQETPDERRARIDQRKAKLKERAQAIELGRGPPVRLLISGNKGGRLTLLAAPFDGDDEFSQVWKSRYAEFLGHLGGELTLPQRRVCDLATRLSLIADVAWTAVNRDGVLVKTRGPRKGQPTGAVEAFTRAARGEIELLKLIGLERRAKHVPSISEILAQSSPPGGDATPVDDTPPGGDDNANADVGDS